MTSKSTVAILLFTHVGMCIDSRPTFYLNKGIHRNVQLPTTYEQVNLS